MMSGPSQEPTLRDKKHYPARSHFSYVTIDRLLASPDQIQLVTRRICDESVLGLGLPEKKICVMSFRLHPDFHDFEPGSGHFDLELVNRVFVEGAEVVDVGPPQYPALPTQIPVSNIYQCETVVRQQFFRYVGYPPCVSPARKMLKNRR